MPRRARSSLEASRGFLAYLCSATTPPCGKAYPRVLVIQSDVPGHDLGDALERNPITESSISAREQQVAWRGGPTATLPITFADPSPNHLVDEENSNLTTPPAAASPPLENGLVWPKVSVQLGGSCPRVSDLHCCLPCLGRCVRCDRPRSPMATCTSVRSCEPGRARKHPRELDACVQARQVVSPPTDELARAQSKFVGPDHQPLEH